ncbi:MAG: HlyD family efflux transporter periplasmic adaptor subunit [Myxococcaceae bacterium]|nr:HlyD family efflux transporter periplasmic adaptor subunit [Myxococcaceae bacterium]
MIAARDVSGVERSTALLVRTPRALRLVSRLLSLGLVGTGVSLALVPWQQSVEGSGRVVAFAAVERRQNVDAPIEGRVKVWHVREGGTVKRGDVLVEITDNDPLILMRLEQERVALKARLAAASARIESVGSRMKALEASRNAAVKAAASRVTMAGERTKAAKQALEGAQGAAKAAQLNFDRQKTLQEQGLTSTRGLELAELERVRTATEVDRARAGLLGAEAEALALEADRLRVGADLDALLDDARATEAMARVEEANSSAELARLEVRLARQSNQVVHAPADGRVFRLYGGVGGEFVKAGDPLMMVVPDTLEPAVEVWLDGNDVPLVTEGRKVRLQFEGWPAVQFTGWPSVAVGTFGGVVALVDSHDDGGGRFRVVIQPDPADAPWPSGRFLRQGMRVNAWVLLDQVKLGFELWRRFSGFPPSLSTVPAEAAKDGGKK